MKEVTVIQTGRTFKVYCHGVLVGNVSIITLAKFLREGVWMLTFQKEATKKAA